MRREPVEGMLQVQPADLRVQLPDLFSISNRICTPGRPANDLHGAFRTVTVVTPGPIVLI